MILSNAALILAGIACICIASYTLYAAIPQAGKPPAFWTRTDNRSTVLAVGLVTLFVMGAGLLLRGILA
jgi:hypothetical protein